MTALDLRPVTRDQARAFVAAHHRHNEPPISWLFGAGLYAGDELRAVAMAGRPIAPSYQDGRTIEITRVCTLGDRNAASRLYGALCRAAAALGYRRALTYSLLDEPGSSIRGAGFHQDGRTIETRGWRRDSARRPEEPRLWGPARAPIGPKIRWIRDL